MSMRVDCRHCVSEQYSSGRIVERCALNWAPAAPWDCPQTCERFLPVERVIDLRDSVLTSEIDDALARDLDLRALALDA